MKRGDFVSVVMQGDLGKPRPALVIQSNYFISQHSSVTILPVTSTIVPAPLLRITIHPTPENGLQKPSQVMIDKAMTIKKEKIGSVFGEIDAKSMVEVERCLAIFLGLG